MNSAMTILISRFILNIREVMKQEDDATDATKLSTLTSIDYSDSPGAMFTTMIGIDDVHDVVHKHVTDCTIATGQEIEEVYVILL